MNEKVLAQMLAATRETSRSLRREFRIFEVETSTGRTDGAKRIAEAVANLALKVIEEHLREDVLSLPKEEVSRTFAGRRSLNSSDAAALVKRSVKAGHYKPGGEAGAEGARFLVLPVMVVRNKSGRLLRLRRKSRTGQDPLNEKIVIWTGGPVRKQDGTAGDPVLHCALREIEEALRLGLEAHELKLRGAVYCGPGGEAMPPRVAIVYEWKAKSDAVEVVLSRAEFFGSRGTAVSGTFVPLRDIVRDVDDGKITEELSVEIVRELLAKDYKFTPRLF
jgi:predicted NUDIX family phosphoesterase